MSNQLPSIRQSLFAWSLGVALAASLPVLAVALWFVFIVSRDDHTRDLSVRSSAECALAAQEVRAAALECRGASAEWMVHVGDDEPQGTERSLAEWDAASRRLHASLERFAACGEAEALQASRWQAVAAADAARLERISGSASLPDVEVTDGTMSALDGLPEQVAEVVDRLHGDVDDVFLRAAEEERTARAFLIAVTAGAGIVAVALSGALALMVGHRARRIASEAARLSAGDLATPVARDPRRDELAAAAAALERLRQMVRVREAELVRERDKARTVGAARAAEARILEMITRGAPLDEVLRETVLFVESQLPGVRASVLLRKGESLGNPVAPSMPPSFIGATTDFPIGPDSGCCGAAAFRGERTVAFDVQLDPRWAEGRELAREWQVRSCWSEPVCSATGEVLGCFAMYRAEPHEPTAEELEAIRQAARVAGIAIERAHTDGALRSAVQELAAARDAETRQSRELASRNAELEHLREAAEAASAVKSEFLANMSHEIRTPMTAILGYAELLGQPDVGFDERVGHAATIRRSGEHLLSVIGDILDLSKIEAGRLTVDLVECSPRLILAEVEQVMSQRAKAKGIAFTLACDPGVPEEVRTDPTRLRQILLNLVGNAIKFTDKGGVDLRVDALPSSGGDATTVTLRCTVRDTGPGMPDDLLHSVFEPFTQADASVSRRHGGTGLGLAISQRLARMLGGDIAVDSTLGEGSVFVATVACGAKASQGAAPSVDVQRRLAQSPRFETSVRILLVDDIPDNLRLMAHHLRQAGAAVDLASSGQAAIGAVAEASLPHDLILMDMQMPGMDGYSATRALRAAGVTTPIVALTAHAMQGDRERCLAAGCDGYLAKPIGRAALVAGCREALRARPPAVPHVAIGDDRA